MHRGAVSQQKLKKSFCGSTKNYFKTITFVDSSCYKSYLHLGAIDLSQMPFEVRDDQEKKCCFTGIKSPYN
jgi:hypothetical protein